MRVKFSSRCAASNASSNSANAGINVSGTNCPPYFPKRPLVIVCLSPIACRVSLLYLAPRDSLYTMRAFRIFDKLSHLGVVFQPWRAFDAGRNVHTPRLDLGNRVAHIFDAQAA